MKEWELTEDEIDQVISGKWWIKYKTHIREVAVGKAYQKKLVEWGEEVCFDKTHHSLAQYVNRRHCPVCWQELLDDLGVK